ncbi:PH domain-containing protein [Priestia megaterium]|uniref:PH domain-containing protein n=1 Tax=Priestia megaterium TaxID=1404 RepID=A0A6M6DYA5_PRIMG|nr:PH domain-containing protein [Priestia megaterium]QJX79901.1 PH domain-containing protein [Priestia megaterium]
MIRRRDNLVEILYYGYTTIKNQIFPILGCIISFIGTENKFTPYIKLFFYGLMIWICIYSFLKWYYRYFRFGDNIISISEGVFTKRSIDVPYSSVKSINTSASLIKRIVGVSDFSLELIGGDKIIFVLTNTQIKELRNQLFNDIHQTKINEANIQKLKPLQYVLISLTNFPTFIASLSLAFSIYGFLIHTYGKYLIANTDKDPRNTIEVLAALKLDDILNLNFLMLMGLFLGVIAAVAYLFSFIFIYLTYGRFATTNAENDVTVEYGILNKKVYHIPKSQIRSLRIGEPFLFRLFGYVQLKIDNIGLTEGRSSLILLHPAVKKEVAKKIIASYIPDFKEQTISLRPEKNSIFSYILSNIVSPIVTFIVLYFISPKLGFMFLFTPLYLLYGYTEWRHSGLSFDNKVLTLQYTKRLRKTTLITLKKFVEATETSQTIFMKKKDVYHYGFAVYSEDQTEEYVCRFLSNSSKQYFLKYLVEKRSTN